MTWRLLPAACAGTLLFTFTAIAQQPEESLREVEPHQLRTISGHEGRTSLGAFVSFGIEDSTGHLGNSRPGNTSASTATLPLWTYQTRAAQNSLTYQGMMVGTNPASGSSATVPAVLVPVILKIKQGSKTYIFDPTAPDTGCLGTGNTAFGLTSLPPCSVTPVSP